MTIDLPDDDRLNILFAHSAFRLADAFAKRRPGIRHGQAWTAAETRDRISEADVAVLSGFWSEDLLDLAPRLKLIHVPAAGYDQFDLEALRRNGVALTNSRGAMAEAVAEHGIGMMLAFVRKLHQLRDLQQARNWRPAIAAVDEREDELYGKRLLIYGYGTIGARLGELARAFGMRVQGVRRTVSDATDGVEVYPPDAWTDLLPEADFVALTCSLNPRTTGLMNAGTLAQMARHAVLVNLARGRCVVESDLIQALKEGALGGACLDCTEVEPLPPSSPLWDLPNVIITPHSAGDTRRYEANVIDILIGNIERSRNGDPPVNLIVAAS